MDTRAHYAVWDAVREAWSLKWHMLAAHLLFLLVFAALLAPAVALALRTALLLSGEPALTDKDIAAFLLSPWGAAAMLAVAALFLAVQVVGLSLKMSIAASARQGGAAGVLAAWRRVILLGPSLVSLALRLVVRVLILTLPFLAVAGAIGLVMLTQYDINYYLSERPPVFLVAVALIAVVLVAMLAVLVPRLLGWALVLPLVLAETSSPPESFAASRAMMQGRRMALAVRLGLWLVLALALGAIVATVGALAAGFGEIWAGGSLSALATGLLAALALVAGLNALAGMVVSSTLGVLLMEEAGWPTLSGANDAPTSWALTAIAAAIVAGGGVVLGTLSLPQPTPQRDIAVIAHRGGAVAAPENTLAAMEQGIEDGADWLEIDVQESAEGEVVVIHDSDFMKVGGDPTKVWDATSEDLARIDVGAWFAPEFAGERTPRLADVLELARGRAKVLIELKYYGHDEALESRVAAIVEELDMVDEVAFMSLAPQQVAAMRSLRPEWVTGLLAATALGRLEEVDAAFLAVSSATATPALIRRAAGVAKQVFVWTINDATGMVRFASIGVDGLITDRPALAREVLAQLGALTPAERAVLTFGDALGVEIDLGSEGDNESR